MRDEEEDYDNGEIVVKVLAKNVPVERCNSCGLIASGLEAAKVRTEAICHAVGLLAPSEIKALRESFGWSQQYLADLTDFGIATVSRWERGRLLQNRSANKVLLALRDCPAFRSYLEGLLDSKRGQNKVELAEPTDRFQMTKETVVKLEQAFQNAREELETLKRQFAADVTAG